VDYNTCSSVLLDDAEVLTAAHCVPENIRNRTDPNGCKAMAFLHSDETEKFACTEVVWSSTDLGPLTFSEKISDDGVSADLLIFKIDHPPKNVVPFTLSKHFTDPSQIHKFWA